MARIRTIKPEFFQHDGLGDLPVSHRLMFIGLWTQADRAGRLRDKPRRLKCAIFPYDDCDVDAILADLARGGFIVRYVFGAEKYIAIPRFSDHQRPHHREPESTIPAPGTEIPGPAGAQPVPARQEGKGREGKGKEGNGDSAPSRTKPKTASRRQHRKPDDIHLTAELRAFAIEADIGPRYVDAEWARFSDHEFKRAISDWSAAWRNWCRRAVEYRRGVPMVGRATTAAGRTMQAVREAFNGRDDAGGISDHRQPPKMRPEPSCAVSGGDLDDDRDAKTAEGGRDG